MRDWLFLSKEAEREFRCGLGRRPTPAEVLRIVSEEAGMPMKELTGRRRDYSATHARQLAMLLIRENCFRRSYVQIGLVLGRDHSTVMHGCQKARRRITEDPDYNAVYLAASARLERRLVS